MTMAFGFSISDFITLGEKTWAVYKACKGASSEFHDITAEVLSLHTVLKELEDACVDSSSLINRAADSKKMELKRIVRSCQRTLDKIDKLVTKYHSLGTDKNRLWHQLGFGATNLDPLRSSLMLSVSNLNLFLTSLETSSLARIEALLERLIEEARLGHKAPTVLSSALDNTGVGWPQLKAELTDEGIPKAEIELYKHSIQEWISKATDQGLFDEVELGNTISSQSVHLRPLSLRAPSTNSSTSNRGSIISQEPIKFESETVTVDERNTSDEDYLDPITFSNPVELRPLSVKVLSVYSNNSGESRVQTPVNLTPHATANEATNTFSDPTDKVMSTTIQAPSSSSLPLPSPRPSPPPEDRPVATTLYKPTSKSNPIGYLPNLEMSAKPINSVRYLPDLEMSAKPINSVRYLPNLEMSAKPINSVNGTNPSGSDKSGSTLIASDDGVGNSSQSAPTSGWMARFLNCCSECACCTDDILDNANDIPKRPGVL